MNCCQATPRSTPRRPFGRTLAVLLTSAAALLAVAACGAGGSATGTAGGGTTGGNAAGGNAGSGQPVAVAKGQPMKASNGESVTVTSFQANFPNGYGTLAAGDQCIKVKLTLTNGSSGDWGDPETEMTVIDAAGKAHRIGTSGSSCPGSAGPIDLAAGQTDDTAQLTCEVPSSGTLNLKWAPVMLPNEAYQTPLQ